MPRLDLVLRASQLGTVRGRTCHPGGGRSRSRSRSLLGLAHPVNAIDCFQQAQSIDECDRYVEVMRIDDLVAALPDLACQNSKVSRQPFLDPSFRIGPVRGADPA